MVLELPNRELGKMAFYFPRLARGHGSLRRGFCNSAWCDPSDPKGHSKHLQERFEIVQEYYNQRVNGRTY